MINIRRRMTIYPINGGGGSTPFFSIFPIGKNGKKRIWKKRETTTFTSLSIYFFTMGKNGKRHFFPIGKNGVGPHYHPPLILTPPNFVRPYPIQAGIINHIVNYPMLLTSTCLIVVDTVSVYFKQVHVLCEIVWVLLASKLPSIQ